ncbi:hypothetical protein XH81_12785 [Bradyrhizobium sp. CCBAU 25360]|uniref:hypothetical protein n=1 Tax=Bradyrhizobium sp. CCBAU 25360 TaxID=858425 RepID=UPI0023068207|nr:hypothetical protein [Bradyrhizobium sp. CCBAU 25360]MDA9415711.1 hypothetical protein [Bradyrhizobium sp. CCBAU 25360]
MRLILLLSILLYAGPATAQDENITLELSPAEALAIVRAQDLWPISKRTPPGFFEVQIKIGRALDQNPDGRKAVKELERSR